MVNSDVSYTIKQTWLLGILLITPLVLVLGFWDQEYNHQALLPHFGLNSLYLPLYLLIFEMPHIIASFVGFADREYTGHYLKHLRLGIPLLLIVFAVLLWIDFEIAVMVYLMATMYHVMKQQTGIALLFGIPKNRWHHLWSWTLIASTAGVYVALFLPSVLSSFSVMQVGVFVSCMYLLSVACGGRLIMQAPTWSGVWYILLTMAMVATSYYMVWLGYIFLAVFVARFVHDVTAFLFYITHEMNRNRIEVRNFLYRFIPFLPASLVVVVPMVAIALGFLLRESIENVRTLFIIVMLLGFTHYYLESVMWKRDAPHRQQVRVG